jgi:aspartate kinase
VVTQGFIGSTDENESTTLGREGSDFTAAIFANLLQAEDVTIWKDVPGVMSGDPKTYSEAQTIPEISYSEMIEMAYYGAQVIHPKTIKPLQNKKIPLLVKNFTDTILAGTSISSTLAKNLPPIVIVKENQVLLSFQSKDFSFIEDQPINKLYELFHNLKIKPTLTQNGAITLLCCFTDREEKINTLATEAAEIFDVTVLRGLSLLTVRHYNDDSLAKLTAGRKILLTQKTDVVVQMILGAERV